MDRKKKIEYILGSICIVPILLGKYHNNKTLIAIGGIPILLYVGILIFDMVIAMDSKQRFIQGKITNIRTRQNKMKWKDFNLILKDGTTKQFSIPELEFPNNISENDYIEVLYKKTGIIGYTYVTKINRLLS